MSLQGSSVLLRRMVRRTITALTTPRSVVFSMLGTAYPATLNKHQGSWPSFSYWTLLATIPSVLVPAADICTIHVLPSPVHPYHSMCTRHSLSSQFFFDRSSALWHARIEFSQTTVWFFLANFFQLSLCFFSLRTSPLLCNLFHIRSSTCFFWLSLWLCWKSLRRLVGSSWLHGLPSWLLFSCRRFRSVKGPSNVLHYAWCSEACSWLLWSTHDSLCNRWSWEIEQLTCCLYI